MTSFRLYLIHSYLFNFIKHLRYIFQNLIPIIFLLTDSLFNTFQKPQIIRPLIIQRFSLFFVKLNLLLTGLINLLIYYTIQNLFHLLFHLLKIQLTLLVIHDRLFIFGKLLNNLPKETIILTSWLNIEHNHIFVIL